jgi:hypothetical protein
MKWVLPALALAALIALTRKELPSMQRYLRIARM